MVIPYHKEAKAQFRIIKITKVIVKKKKKPLKVVTILIDI